MTLSKIDIKDGDGKIVSSTVFIDGGGEPDPDREISENEKWYDKEIAPVLAELAKKCHAKDMAFGAIVEYNPGEEGRTVFETEEMSLAMHLAVAGIHSEGNIDKAIMRYENSCKKKGRDLAKESIYVRLANRG